MQEHSNRCPISNPSLRRLMLAGKSKSYADPQFFGKRSRTELLNWKESKLVSAGRLMFPMIFNELDDHYYAVEWGYCFNLIKERAGSTRAARILHAPIEEISCLTVGSCGISCEDVVTLPTLGSLLVSSTRSAPEMFDKQGADLVVHLGRFLSRSSLIVGKATLLLPLSEDAVSGTGAIETFIAPGSGWSLPLGVIAREVARHTMTA